MDRASGIFVDGIGAAAATSGVLTQLQGRIFIGQHPVKNVLRIVPPRTSERS